MYQESRAIFLYTETSFHAGSGDSIVGVDLPIQREQHTNFPKDQGGGVKGALRDLARNTKPKIETEEIEAIFGPETDNARLHQGALTLTEARILLFPVKSLKGVFAWVTCPFVIERFKRDLKRLNSNYAELDAASFASLGNDVALTTNPCSVVTSGGGIVLEDLAFTANATKKNEVFKLAKWIAGNALPNDGKYDYWTSKLKNSLLVVSDEVFRDFVVYYTEVNTRHKRDGETGTVKTGALWNEETLPPDTLMYSRILASKPNKENSPLKTASAIIKKTEKIINRHKFIQMGGNETVGQGFLSVTCFNPHLRASAPETGAVGDTKQPPESTVEEKKEEINDEPTS